MDQRRVGFVGFRGMVGSVLMERMKAEGDFKQPFTPRFYSTSQVGAPPPAVGVAAAPLADARDVKDLATQDVIVSCQGGDYTKEVHPQLRAAGWRGYWIDAASALRMQDSAVIVLDPVNQAVIDRALAAGVRDLVGGNCTVSLMLMALHGLYAEGWIEWVSSMTYQAASGAGAKQMQELVAQMRAVAVAGGPLLDDPSKSALDLDQRVHAELTGSSFPREQLGAPLAGSLIPWIDSAVAGGQTREEWKGHAESNKILGLSPEVPVDGICVRVGAMRCHSQGLTIKLKRAVPLPEVERVIRASNPWVELVENTPEATKARLSPAAVSGTLKIAIGRLHTLKMGPDYLGAFTVGDQLLWGAAEPLRRVLLQVLAR
jgi:aspartate-semialdehyde dehydrogenase